MDALWLCPTTAEVNCSWSGPDYEMLPHFRTCHNDLLLNTNSFPVDISDDKISHKLLNLDDETYLVQLEKNSQTLLLKLRFLGTREKASQFAYNAEVTSGDFSFKYLPNESCNCVYFGKGCIEVDIQTIKITVGNSKLEQLTFVLDIQRKPRAVSSECKEIADEPPNEETPPQLEQNPQTTNEEDETLTLQEAEEETILGSESASETLSETSGNGTSSRASHRNSSFLQHFFFDDSVSVHSDDKTESKFSLECTNCGLEMYPPIYLCEEGHSVCNGCKLEKCHLCGKKITTLRNGDLEEISKRLKHACRYANYGCYEKHRYDEIRLHELNCRFCIYKCCLCSEEGRFPEMKSHFKLFHSSTRIYETMTNKFPKNNAFAIINRECGVFYCVSEVKGGAIEWSVTFCGPKERWFSCELRFKGRKGDVSYFLTRDQNHYRLILLLNDLKAANVKDKYAELLISSY